MENRCVCCGEIIPEGIQVCYSCMNSFITDVAPVRHGHWISLTDCSNAGVYCSILHLRAGRGNSAGLPVCGMVGGVGNE